MRIKHNLKERDMRWLGWAMGGAIVGGFLLFLPRIVVLAGGGGP